MTCHRFWTYQTTLLFAVACLCAADSGQAFAVPQETKAQAVPRIDVDEQKLEANGIRTIKGKHLTVHTDIRDRADVEELANVFDQAVPQWCQYFGVDDKLAEAWRLDASIIVDQSRFERAGLFPADLPQFLAGFQRGDQIWVYIQQGDYYTRHLLLHEGTHAFMNQFLGGLPAPWYAEGMAELLGLNAWRESKLELAYRVTSRDETPFWGRVALLRAAVERGELKSLEDVLQIPGPAFRQVESYAWAWAACEFLSRHPLSEKTFAALPAHCADSAEVFNRRLTEALKNDWPALEFQWRQFLFEVDYGYDVPRAAISPAKKISDHSNQYTIDADRGWQSTGVGVTNGKSLTITASGEFQIARDTEPWPCQANGVTVEYYRGIPLGRLIAAVLPSPDSEGSLADLIEIDVGSSATITPLLDGELLLRLNDSPAHWRDNAGNIEVNVR
jgi:hypothetical protein